MYSGIFQIGQSYISCEMQNKNPNKIVENHALFQDHTVYHTSISIWLVWLVHIYTREIYHDKIHLTTVALYVEDYINQNLS